MSVATRRILTAVSAFAKAHPERLAVESGNGDLELSYAQLDRSVSALAAALEHHDIGSLALVVDNGPAWILADLAAMRASVPIVPVPHFFSHRQIDHLFRTAGINAVITDRPEAVYALCEAIGIGHIRPVEIREGGVQLYLFQLTVSPVALPARTAKVTFTSGSTGEPKGVCLSLQSMTTVAHALAEVTGARESDRHLSLLPYATLLENVGGIYAPLLSGATIIAPSLAAIGLSGAAGLDVARLVGMLDRSGATTCIMIPQMLHALAAAVAAGVPKPASLRYVAVGGAPVSHSLLEQCRALGLPVFEGYGLSEAASVVAVNREGANRPGSVGQLLPHVSIRFADDGEILVAGTLFAGYLGDATPLGHYWPTGNIGYLDEDGYLYLTGRKKHIFITAFGRNVSPEWVERELSIEAVVGQCCVFGEAQPFNVAVIVPRANGNASVVADLISEAVANANARLPDYARVTSWIVADEPFTVESGLWTGTGRPRREQIFSRYHEAIDACYSMQAMEA